MAHWFPKAIEEIEQTLQSCQVDQDLDYSPEGLIWNSTGKSQKVREVEDLVGFLTGKGEEKREFYFFTRPRFETFVTVVVGDGDEEESESVFTWSNDMVYILEKLIEHFEDKTQDDDMQRYLRNVRTLGWNNMEELTFTHPQDVDDSLHDPECIEWFKLGGPTISELGDRGSLCPMHITTKIAYHETEVRHYSDKPGSKYENDWRATVETKTLVIRDILVRLKDSMRRV
ncbi:hypothetical protein IE53DRAFT_396904 [Violaceomyces palustris]|uniref:Uncharacterized protein n=1 Tax=Violaceomyces palustris TaxID=1673888 RepID=A0ACD0NVD4_9BASI|nr:hypothetical protein IE53DRAFT_396904 [Violaceomyces palustris]